MNRKKILGLMVAGAVLVTGASSLLNEPQQRGEELLLYKSTKEVQSVGDLIYNARMSFVTSTSGKTVSSQKNFPDLYIKGYETTRGDNPLKREMHLIRYPSTGQEEVIATTTWENGKWSNFNLNPNSKYKVENPTEKESFTRKLKTETGIQDKCWRELAR